MEITKKSCIFAMRKKIAGWSSWSARVAHNHKVDGSSPSPATNCEVFHRRTCSNKMWTIGDCGKQSVT